jgi:hypothetical protein
LHQLDQVQAFQILRGGGLTEEDIAARHFVTWRSRCETSSSFAFWRLSARVDLQRMAAIGGPPKVMAVQLIARVGAHSLRGELAV